MSSRGPVRASPTGAPLARPSSDKGVYGQTGRCCPLRLRLLVTSGPSGSPLVAVIAARALYAGTLATIRTTAPSLQRSCAQLAALCLLATLTAAARCYACSNATQTLAQFGPTPSSFSPIHDSNARPHSSTLVLSRPSIPRPVQSDTSVILTNSKKLLLNQNSNETIVTRRKRSRTKRELKPTEFNRIAEQTKRNALGITKLNLKKRSDVLVSSETDDSVGDSDRVNSSIVNTVPEAEHQNDSSFVDEDDPHRHSEGTERPMPPVHDHGNASYAVGCERRRRGGGGRHGPSARRKSGQRTGGDEGPPSETARCTYRHSHQPAAQHSHAGRRGTPIRFQTAHTGPRTGVRDPPKMHPTAA